MSTLNLHVEPTKKNGYTAQQTSSADSPRASCPICPLAQRPCATLRPESHLCSIFLHRATTQDQYQALPPHRWRQLNPLSGKSQHPNCRPLHHKNVDQQCHINTRRSIRNFRPEIFLRGHPYGTKRIHAHIHHLHSTINHRPVSSARPRPQRFFPCGNQPWNIRPVPSWYIGIQTMCGPLGHTRIYPIRTHTGYLVACDLLCHCLPCC
jgi:hypothetical protein